MRRFRRFGLRMVTGSPTAETKKAIINALIHRVDILENGFKLGFYVGTGQIKKGEALASPSFLQQKKSLSAGSSLLFNGGPGRNRTCNSPLGKGRYIHLTTGPKNDGLIRMIHDEVVVGQNGITHGAEKETST